MHYLDIIKTLGFENPTPEARNRAIELMYLIYDDLIEDSETYYMIRYQSLFLALDRQDLAKKLEEKEYLTPKLAHQLLKLVDDDFTALYQENGFTDLEDLTEEVFFLAKSYRRQKDV